MHFGNKKVIEFTYGEYSSEDPYVGLFMALISYTPIVSAIVVSSLTIALRSWHNFCFFCGLVFSHEIASILKSVFKQQRPAGAYLRTYGMPSDHSMFMFFIASYLISHMKAHADLKKRSFAVSSIALVILSGLVGLSRVYLGVHTVEQVIVGALLGIVVGRIWYDFSRLILLKSKFPRSMFERLHDTIVSIFYATSQPSKKSKT